jgi:hypothetical protein
VSSFSYKWLRNRVVISGQNSNTYIVSETDEGSELTCIVTGTNSSGEVEDESVNALLIPGSRRAAPVNTEAPKVVGSPEVGQELKCSEGRWTGNPAPTFSYQWLRNGESIETATTSTYRVVSADEGQSLSCRVTATNSAGSASKLSNSVKVAGTPPRNTAAPEVQGVAAVGEQLTCLPGSWEGVPTPTYTYVWLRGSEAISGATASTYRIASSDQGQSLKCRVTASNGEGKPVEAESRNSIRIPDSKPENTKRPEVVGEPRVGQELTCNKGEWSATPPQLTFTYEWLRNGAAVGANGEKNTVTIADRGHSLS